VTSTTNPTDGYPLLAGKAYTEPSVFQPENLLREARRQKQLPDIPVPAVCLLDPDGDVVRHLTGTGTGRRHPGWACYHTEMWVTQLPASGGDAELLELGVVGCAVGAPFAVLVAEQLHASGAELVVSITSAGQLVAQAEPPYFVLIEAALRDEGTSAHYLPPAPLAQLTAPLRAALTDAFTALTEPMVTGLSWTTDAPYRETQSAIDAATAAGAVCVEMEAAALYAYATARHRDVVCLAHVTNTMATTGDDFEKGHANGAVAALAVTATIARTLHSTRPRPDTD
jgi:uridine phosphorylase